MEDDVFSRTMCEHWNPEALCEQCDPPLLDEDGYPTEATLERVRTWPVRAQSMEEDHRALLAFVRDLWRYADVGYWRESGGVYEISTGGWSGNESLAAAMARNPLFWSMCWVSSRRGGHHVLALRSANVSAFAPRGEASAVNVETCGQCPWVGGQPLRCWAPEAPDAHGRAVGSGKPPPEWCPLRERPMLVRLRNRQ